MYLMFKDKKVLEFDIDENKFKVLDKSLLPYSIREHILDPDSAASEVERR